MAGLRWKAVLIGSLVDFFGTVAVSFLAAITAMALGLGPEAAQLQFNTPTLIAILVLGLGFTSLGGFVGARIAGIEHIKHGVAVGIAMLLLGFLLIPFGGMPFWYDAASIVFIVPAGWLGGYLAAGVGKAPASPQSS